MLDLWAANESQLQDAGISGDRIDNPRICTGCRTDLFYSYRRGHNGRLVSIAAIASNVSPPHPTLSPDGGEGDKRNPLP
jgi:copper oxidase (laccase) domain-containing protein